MAENTNSEDWFLEVLQQAEEKIKMTEWSLSEFQSINDRLDSHFKNENS